MSIKDKFTNGSFLLLYVIVMIVSLISSVQFFEIAHETWMSWMLAIGFELGAACCLIGVITNKKNIGMIYVMLIILTLFQMMANVFAAYTNLNDLYRDWTTLFYMDEIEDIDKRRIISMISGAILPLVALGFVHILASNLEKKEDKQEVVEEEPIKEDPIVESSPEPIEKKEEPIEEVKEEPVVVVEKKEEPKEVKAEPVIVEKKKEHKEVKAEPIKKEEPKEVVKKDTPKSKKVEATLDNVKKEPQPKVEPKKPTHNPTQDEIWMNSIYNRI